MPAVGFETTISRGEQPQTHALDRAATGTGLLYVTILLDLHSHAAVVEAVGRRSVTTVGQFRFQTCPFEIFGGQTGTGTRFLSAE
jgi:hypothetical protein